MIQLEMRMLKSRDVLNSDNTCLFLGAIKASVINFFGSFFSFDSKMIRRNVLHIGSKYRKYFVNLRDSEKPD